MPRQTLTPISAAPDWIPTQATVTSCRFQFARMNTFTLGIQTGEKFCITFDYYAHGHLYSDEFQSPTAIPQNQTIPILYNPLNPAENNRTSGPGTPSPRGALIGIGIAGSILLSLAWLLILRSCNPS